MTDPKDWPWPDELDALVAAPDSHIVLLEDDAVRVVEVVIQPGRREPQHTHRWPSVMIVDEPARIRYYGEGGRLEFESAERTERRQGAAASLRAERMGPEGPHSVENVDEVTYHAIRVEFKGG